MTVAHVTEITRRPEPVGHDPFADGLGGVLGPGEDAPAAAPPAASRRPGARRGGGRRGATARARDRR